MRSIVKFSLRHGIRVISLLLIMISVAIYGIFHIPVGLYPEVMYPHVKIEYFYTEQDPSYIAQKYTPYVEGFIWSMKGVKSVKSVTTEHMLKIDVTLKQDERADRFAVKVIDALKYAELPDFFAGPFINTKGTVRRRDFEFYMENIRKNEADILLNTLRTIDGVRDVEILGYLNKFTTLTPCFFKLRDLSLNLNAISKELEAYGERLSIHNGGEILQIGVRPVSLYSIFYKGVALKDLFKISSGYKNVMYIVDGRPAVLFKIRFRSDVNKITVSRRVRRVISDYEKKTSNRAVIIYDVGKRIKHEYTKILFSFVAGIFFLMLVLFAFEGSMEESVFIISVALLSLLCTISLFFLMGVQVNVITISGLVFGLGLFVDSALVFFEEFSQNILKTKKIRAILESSSNIFGPLLVSILTSLLAFIPFLYASVDIRLKYRYFMLSFSLALIMSLFMTYLVLPLYFIRISSAREVSGKLKGHLLMFYRLLLRYILKKPHIPIGIYIISISMIPFLYKKLNREDILVLKEDKRAAITINITPEEGQVETKIMYKNVIFPLIRAIEEFKKNTCVNCKLHYLMNVTENGSLVEIYMNRDAVIEGMSSNLRAYLESVLSNFKGVNIVMHGGAPWDFVIQEGSVRPFMLALTLYGYNYRKLQKEVKYLARELKKGEYFPLTIYDFHYGGEIPVFYTPMGLTSKNRFLRYRKIMLNSIINYGQKEPVIFKNPEVGYYTLKDRNMPFYKEFKKRAIERKDRYFKMLVGFSYQGPSDSLKDFLERFEKEHPLPAGFYYDSPPIIGHVNKTVKFKIGVIVTCVLITLVIVSMFNEIVSSLMVIFVIPVTILGIFSFFNIYRVTFDVNAILALLVTIGIGVNDSIFLVKKFLINKEVEMAALSRFRSILYTSITTIATAAPFWIIYKPQEIWYKFAHAIIGGITFSTIYTIFILPAFIKSFMIKNR